jgi:amino acid adenylation domain-containing protein
LNGNTTIERIVSVTTGASESNDRTPVFERSDPSLAGCVSFAQQRLWFLDRLYPHLPLYNISFNMRLEGQISIPILRAAINHLVERHETLRSSFPDVEGEPALHLRDADQVEPPLLDLTACRPSESMNVALQAVRPFIRAGFDLARGPLYRVALVRLAPADHVLVLAFHHIIFDGWSISVVLRDLQAAYTAFAMGRNPDLPRLPIQYADYAWWQRARFEQSAGEDAINRWAERLTGIDPLALPIDRKRPNPPTNVSMSSPIRISNETAGGLKALCGRQRATMAMTLLAALQLLLYRYSAQRDISIGMPVAGRNRAEFESLVGLFVNTVVIRSRIRPDDSFADLVAQARAQALEAYSNQDVPFEKIVDRVCVDRTPWINPLFQVMFAYQNLPPATLRKSAVQLSPFRVETGVSRFDLIMNCWDSDNGQIGALEHNADVFTAENAGRMARHLECLLEAVAVNPNRLIYELEMLTESEREQILVEWNRGEHDSSHDRCLHELFEAQARCAPEAVGVMCQKEELNYQELDWKANRLAHYLRGLGVGPDVMVGICLDRSIDMVIGLLGILKAGGAYVPLDPSYPPERLSFMLQDAGISLLVSRADLVAGLPVGAIKVVDFAGDWNVMNESSWENPDSKVKADNLAYVIYTSGSTGRPKGVQITHRAVVNLLSSMSRQLGFTSDDRLLSVTTLSFDIAAMEIFLPLMAGARLILVSRETASDAAQLSTSLADSGATVMQATPVTWQMLVETGWRCGKRLNVYCGGESLSRELADELLDRCGSVWNLYGPTETTIWSTACQLQTGDEIVSIGRPIAHTQTYVLDRDLQPLPAGAPGDLYISGLGLSRGYWHRCELTAEKFIPHPFSEIPGDRMYKTGDRARYLADGRLECLGRTDAQVKLRGYRIELGEIEAKLNEHPGIKQAVVVARERTPGDKHLVAYLAVESTTAPGHDELRGLLREWLPEHMIPSVFVKMEALPRMPNGKIDRTRLPEPTILNDQSTSPPPTSDLEKMIAEVWSLVLGVARVGIDDQFFDSGGNSLSLSRVQHKLEQRLNRSIPLTTLFAYPTIRTLSQHIAGETNLSEAARRGRLQAARRLRATRTGRV